MKNFIKFFRMFFSNCIKFVVFWLFLWFWIYLIVWDFISLRFIMEEKFKVSNDIEKTSKLPVPLIVFIVVFTLVIFIFLFAYIKNGKSSIYGYDYWFFVVIGLFFLFPIWMSFWIYKTLKSSRSMKKHIEDWTIITKKAEITRFSYYYSSDDHGSDEWYYVTATDGMNEYKSKLLERARLTQWYLNESINKDYCLKKWIPYSPNDPKYNKDFVLKRIKEIDEQIDLLREESRDMSFFAKIKNQFKIDKLYEEKNKLFPPSLICNGRNLYIWDEVTVLVDPDNPKNYEMQI